MKSVCLFFFLLASFRLKWQQRQYRISFANQPRQNVLEAERQQGKDKKNVSIASEGTSTRGLQTEDFPDETTKIEKSNFGIHFFITFRISMFEHIYIFCLTYPKKKKKKKIQSLRYNKWSKVWTRVVFFGHDAQILWCRNFPNTHTRIKNKNKKKTLLKCCKNVAEFS